MGEETVCLSFPAIAPSVFSRGGALHLTNGKLRSESEKGQATYTLQTKNGKPLLVGDAVDQKGIRYHAELTRAQ